MKTCVQCKSELCEEEFYKHRGRPDGLSGYCKKCDLKAAKGRRAGYRERFNRGEVLAPTEKLCCTCREVLPASAFNRARSKPDGLHTQCRACNNAACRAHKAEHPTKPDADKDRARGRLTKAVKRGEIDRAPCAVCGLKDAEAHHEDYSRPLDVIWLCHAHHMELHMLKRISQETSDGVDC